MWMLIAIAAVAPKTPPELNKPMFVTFLGLCAAIFCLVEYLRKRARRKRVAQQLTAEQSRRIESRIKRLFAPVHYYN
jgi:hypothetical protein